jgi:preprotein translocase subunit SecA
MASEALAAVLVQAGIEHQLLNARQDADEAAQVARAGEAGRVTVATNMAGRGTDIRLAAEAEAVGGLQVILTEYHESPRIDRQLVGRCARQGDRGSAVGVVALDDELLSDHGGWLRRLLAPAGLKLPGPWALQWLRRECQRRAGRQGERLRRQTMKQERQTDDALAFAGQTR